MEGPETGPCCDDYRKRMNTAFIAGERTDAMYMRDEDAAEWAEAKWALPLDNMPGAKDLTRDEYPFITEQTNYKGKKYGTIYYVGPVIAFYNKEILKQAGFQRPPGTWDEFRQQAVQIKRQKINGIEFPRYGAPSEGDLENWYLASGKRMFDDDLQPIFGKDVLFKDILDKMYQAYTGDQIFGLDSGGATAFDNGKAVYSWGSFYDLKRLNGLAQATGSQSGGSIAGGAAAGQLTNYVNPSFVAGKTGTQAICRQYAIFGQSKFPQESWKLISFLGGKDGSGKYTVAKRWWVEQGLNFGYKSMAEDPEIKKFVEAWGNLDDYNKVLLAASPRPGVKAPWSALWRTEFTKVVTDVMDGKTTSKDAVERVRPAVDDDAPGLRAHPGDVEVAARCSGATGVRRPGRYPDGHERARAVPAGRQSGPDHRGEVTASAKALRWPSPAPGRTWPWQRGASTTCSGSPERCASWAGAPSSCPPTSPTCPRLGRWWSARPRRSASRTSCSTWPGSTGASRSWT